MQNVLCLTGTLGTHFKQSCSDMLNPKYDGRSSMTLDDKALKARLTGRACGTTGCYWRYIPEPISGSCRQTAGPQALMQSCGEASWVDCSGAWALAGWI